MTAAIDRLVVWLVDQIILLQCWLEGFGDDWWSGKLALLALAIDLIWEAIKRRYF